MEIACQNYIKVVILKVDPFYSEVIDEKNFGLKDKTDILNFKNRYSDTDYVIVDVVM